MKKQLSIYQRLCAISPVKAKAATKAAQPGLTFDQRLARVGVSKPSTKATSPYEAAVIACRDTEKQMEAAKLAYETTMQNFSDADRNRRTLKADLLMAGNTAEVQRVNEKYELGDGDFPSEIADRLGFNGGRS